jgi:transcription elongation GreA/GreB family factor
MNIEAELSQIIAAIKPARNALPRSERKAYRAALRQVKILRKTGATTAEISAWANAN